MSRTIDAATLAELSSDGLRLAKLVQMDFTSVIRLTDYGRDVTALSQTWSASDHFLGISEAVETSELRINSLTIQLAGAEQTYISQFLNNDYHDIRTRVWFAFLDSSDAVIGDPILTFDGRISDFILAESEERVTIEISVASHWANFEATNGRRTNHNSQQLHFAGDDGFEYAADTVDDIKWGRA